ncbi:hypothetical protein, partial [Streptococcus pneumoniae]|uniref:hypothetical protein n=1 Tax=Streptococcus pneumoniae TaxID=1313 RepID=UPI00077BBD64
LSSKMARERALLDVSKANTFITHSYLFVCLLLYYKSQRMGIFFLPKQKASPLRQRGRQKIKKVLSFSNKKVNKKIERFFVRSVDKSC